MKKILRIQRAPAPHWVGNGFHVNSLFFYAQDAQTFSPFLMLDYGAPRAFPPSTEPRGVGQHPHRGFETVTVAYQGEIEHHDSEGNRGVIGPGDVQWMTAAAGIVHEEFHAPAFARAGGRFEMAQLWVNLPARDKSAAPGYQSIAARDIPAVDLPDGAGVARIIAGAYGGARGPARTFTPIDVWDLRLKAGKSARLSLPEGHTLNLAVFAGPVVVNGEATADKAQFVTLARTGGDALLEAKADAKILVLSGAPIEEPVVAYGPFVMNSEDEIRQAFADYRAGRFGALA